MNSYLYQDSLSGTDGQGKFSREYCFRFTCEITQECLENIKRRYSNQVTYFSEITNG